MFLTTEKEKSAVHPPHTPWHEENLLLFLWKVCICSYLLESTAKSSNLDAQKAPRTKGTNRRPVNLLNKCNINKRNDSGAPDCITSSVFYRYLWHFLTHELCFPVSVRVSLHFLPPLECSVGHDKAQKCSPSGFFIPLSESHHLTQLSNESRLFIARSLPVIVVY